MPILKDIAQVLRIYEQGNTSIVAVMLGRELGQFRVHIKGGRRWPKKGFEGGFDLLARGEILVYPRRGETLWVFKEWDERIRAPAGTSLEQLRAISYLCELSEALTRHTAGSGDPEISSEENEELFDVLAAASDALRDGANLGTTLLIFTLSALQIQGFLPELKACSECGRDFRKPAKNNGPDSQKVWLNSEGVRCEECTRKALAQIPQTRERKILSKPAERGAWLSAEAHRALIFLQTAGRPVKVSPAAAQQMARALIVLVHGALEHDLRTLNAAARMVAGVKTEPRTIRGRT